MILGLEIKVEEIDKIIILRLFGRIDASSSPLLQNRLNNLLKEGHERVLLDFSNIDYLSSAGLRVLLSFTKKYKKKVAIFSVTEEVLDIIKLTGFDKILDIYKSEKEAILEKNL